MGKLLFILFFGFFKGEKIILCIQLARLFSSLCIEMYYSVDCDVPNCWESPLNR